MRLDLTDEEATVLLRLLNRASEDDRYPLSPRIRTLRTSEPSSPVHHPNHRQRDRRRPRNAIRAAPRARGDGSGEVSATTALFRALRPALGFSDY